MGDDRDNYNSVRRYSDGEGLHSKYALGVDSSELLRESSSTLSSYFAGTPGWEGNTDGKNLGGVSAAVGGRLLTGMQLIAITFFAVTGGPYGLEDAVGAGGARLVALGLVLAPLLWSLPLALMTAELACMMPESGGHVLWVYRAFGPFWSCVNSVFAFACSVFDNALYPALFIDYLSAALYGARGTMPFGAQVALKVGLLAAVTLLNIRGVNAVGVTAIGVGAAVLAPFVVMLLWGAPKFNLHWLHAGEPQPVNWAKLVTILLWNTSGFDAVGTCAAEVRVPGVAYPRALGVGVLLMVVTYALPVLLGVSVLPDYSMWHDGMFVDVANLVGGQPLKVWMGLAGALSAVGLLLTRLCTNARLLYGMSLVDHVPVWVGSLHAVYATPWAALLLTSGCTLLLTGFHFTALAEADMLFYALSTVLKFGALIKLRFAEPEAYRPFRIPLSNALLICSVTPALGLCVAMLVLASTSSHLIALCGAVFAVGAYVSRELCQLYYVTAEEMAQERLQRIQRNLAAMQERISTVLDPADPGSPLSRLPFTRLLSGSPSFAAAAPAWDPHEEAAARPSTPKV